MNKALELIEKLIKEHKKNGYCTDYKSALTNLEYDADLGFDTAYDVGRYETLTNLYNELTHLQNEEKI